MIAGHAFKGRTSAASDSHKRRLTAAVAGKQRHAILQRGEEDGGGLTVEGGGQFTLADGRSNLFISWLIFSARRCLRSSPIASISLTAGLEPSTIMQPGADPGGYRRGRC